MSAKNIELAAQIIGDLGGTAKTAEMCDITPGAVSQWRRTGIPKAQLNYIKAARPDLFRVVRARAVAALPATPSNTTPASAAVRERNPETNA